MKKVEKLAERLKKELDIEIDPATFKRARVGYWQRNQGAWSWFASRVGQNYGNIGSQWSVTELLKAEKWEKYNHMDHVSIDPITQI